MAPEGRATLEIVEAPELGPGARRFTVDCPHATTAATILPGGQPVGDAEVVRVLAVSHAAHEGCGCAMALLRELGLAVDGDARAN